MLYWIVFAGAASCNGLCSRLRHRGSAQIRRPERARRGVADRGDGGATQAAFSSGRAGAAGAGAAGVAGAAAVPAAGHCSA